MISAKEQRWIERMRGAERQEQLPPVPLGSWAVRHNPDGTSYVRVNKALPLSKALQILRLLEPDERVEVDAATLLRIAGVKA